MLNLHSYSATRWSPPGTQVAAGSYIETSPESNERAFQHERKRRSELPCQVCEGETSPRDVYHFWCHRTVSSSTYGNSQITSYSAPEFHLATVCNSCVTKQMLKSIGLSLILIIIWIVAVVRFTSWVLPNGVENLGQIFIQLLISFMVVGALIMRCKWSDCGERAAVKRFKDEFRNAGLAVKAGKMLGSRFK
jgi:hypothetical protein